MRIIKAPERVLLTALRPAQFTTLIFLAGSIEMGLASNWQEEAEKLIYIYEPVNEIFVFNPRRDDWNSSWKQDKNCKEFKEQVDWELDYLEIADHILLYLDPLTKSPVTLLELGLFAREGMHRTRLIVVCPEGFYRKGNVDIVCERFGIPQFDTLPEAIQYIFNYKTQTK